MNVIRIDVHDFGKSNQNWISIRGPKRPSDICNVRYSCKEVICPAIELLVLIDEEGGFEKGAILMEEREGYLDWAVVAVVDLNLFVILVVGEAQWFFTKFAVHENTRYVSNLS